MATNFGPLAVTSANLWALDECRGSKFFLGALTPITLSTVASEKLDIVKRPGELVGRLVKKLEEKTKECMRPENLSTKSNVREDPLITYLELLSDGESNTGPATVGNGPVKLPHVELTEAKISIKNWGEVDGWLGVALVPLTGSFGAGKGGKLLVFREKSSKDVESFGIALEASYLVAVRELVKRALRKLSRERSNACSRVWFVVDTTHGLNNATAAMTRVLEDALPLLRYEALKQGFSDVSCLYYNSGPALNLGGNDDESLKRTRGNNVSYYYVVKRGSPLSRVVDSVRGLVEEGRGERAPGALRGVYLLRHGLIPWGLYDIELADSQSLCNDRFIEVSVNDSSVKDSIVEFRCVGSVKSYIEALASWLASLATDCVKKLGQELKSEAEGAERACWQLEKPKSLNVRCYPLKWLKRLFENGGKGDWAVRFINEVVEPVGKLVFAHEVEEWLRDPLSRLRYQVPPAFELREASRGRRCSEALGLRKRDEYYCVTPMRVQENTRNVVAHAGLTGVHAFTAFVFKDSEGDESGGCECYAICMAARFPYSKLA